MSRFLVPPDVPDEAQSADDAFPGLYEPLFPFELKDPPRSFRASFIISPNAPPPEPPLNVPSVVENPFEPEPFIPPPVPSPPVSAPNPPEPLTPEPEPFEIPLLFQGKSPAPPFISRAPV